MVNSNNFNPHKSSLRSSEILKTVRVMRSKLLRTSTAEKARYRLELEYEFNSINISNSTLALPLRRTIM